MVITSKKVLEITTTIFDGVRSSELHLDNALSHELSIDGVSSKNVPAEALTSAKRGSRAAFNLLAKEGYLHCHLMVEHQLPSAAINHHGFSSDLSFALALIVNTATFKRFEFPAIAASGVVDVDGSICKVGHIKGKLHSALEKLPKNSLIFLPKANQADVPALLSSQCEDQNIRLHFVDRLEDVCITLGITVRKLYKKNPFRGLEVFDLEHRSLFFGRDNDIEKAIKQLTERQHLGSPSLLVLGASGSGKSSFVQAGLLHELIHADLLPTENQIQYSVFQPRQLKEWTDVTETRGYFSSRLSETLCQHWEAALEVPVNNNFLDVPSAVKFLLQAIRQSPRKKLLAQITYIWIIDQLEEIFTLDWDEQERQAFVELLTALPEHGVYILATLSSDFYADYQECTALLKHFQNGGQYDLLSLDSVSLGSIVREPARLAELSYQNENGIGLDEQILNDVGRETSALPLLEFTLSQLYKERNQAKLQLTYSAYRKMGGVHGAIGSWAQNVYENLPVEEQKPMHLQALVRRLAIVEPESKTSRKTVPLSSLRVASRTIHLKDLPKYLHPLVRSLTGAQARLLVLEQDNKGEVIVRVTHEALLRNWPLVIEQIERDQEQLTLLQQLIQEQLHWQRATQDERSSFLIPSGVRLKRAKKLEREWNDILPKNIRRFISDSYKRSSQRRNKLLLSGGGLSLISLVLGEGYLWTQKHELPVSSIITLQKFRLGYTPLPELVHIAEPRAFLLGEEDTSFIVDNNVPEIRYKNFGLPNDFHPPLDPFYIGKYEVTYEEFDYFVWSQHRLGNTELEYPATAKGGRGKQPASWMTWKEADHYSQWLGEQKGMSCQLPTEQQWEYAAKSGTHTGYPWGKSIVGKASEAMANCASCGSRWDNKQAAPIGSFAPNPFGLYDMNGNVWEMTFTPWDAEEIGGEQARVVRGGSYFDHPALLRSSFRFNKGVLQRHYHIGFRVACELTKQQRSIKNHP